MIKYCLYLLFVLLNLTSLFAQTSNSNGGMEQFPFSQKKFDVKMKGKCSRIFSLIGMDTLIPASISVETIQEKLPNQQTLFIEYFFQDTTFSILGVGKERHIWHEIHLDSLLNNQLYTFLHRIRSQEYAMKEGRTPEGIRIYREQAARIYELFLKPILTKFPAEKEITHLWISPDGPLNQFPFGILLTEGSEASSYAELPYIFHKYAFSYYPSSYHLIREPKRRSEARSLYAGFAPQEVEYDHHFVFGSQWQRIQELEKLSVAEVVQGSVYEGEEANEYWFKRFGRRFRLLHIMVPFERNEKDPLSASLLLRSYVDSENEDRSQDGRLSIAEILQLNVRAEFIFQSHLSLDENTNFPVQSAGALGLAFLEAGCPAIQVPLWRVNNTLVSDMTGLIFQSLNDEFPKDEALNQARKRYLSENERTHPYFWANTVLYGSSASINFGDTGQYMALWGAFVLALLGFGRFLRWRRKRKNSN